MPNNSAAALPLKTVDFMRRNAVILSALPLLDECVRVLPDGRPCGAIGV
jgi:hypothetical protein